jgi:nitrate/nitrite transport system ATP-binding protein
MACLELQNVSKSYRAGARTVDVLSHVNLQVAEGEFVAIVGYSGAGKTTLISLLAGLQAPDAGRALFEGRPMDGPGPERGVVFQNYSLLPWLSAYDNVRLAVDEVHSGWSAERRKRHIEACLAMVSLLNAKDRRPAQLSGGMRQRVALARTFLSGRGLLLLDEPFASLDAITRGSLQEWLAEALRAEPRTVVLVTHDVQEAIYLADRVAVMSRRPGRVVTQIPVPIARPRPRRATVTSPAFTELEERALEALE